MTFGRGWKPWSAASRQGGPKRRPALRRGGHRPRSLRGPGAFGEPAVHALGQGALRRKARVTIRRTQLLLEPVAQLVRGGPTTFQPLPRTERPPVPPIHLFSHGAEMLLGRVKLSEVCAEPLVDLPDDASEITHDFRERADHEPPKMRQERPVEPDIAPKSLTRRQKSKLKRHRDH